MGNKPYYDRKRGVWMVYYRDAKGRRQKKTLSQDKEEAFRLYEEMFVPAMKAKSAEVLHSLVSSAISLEAMAGMAEANISDIQARVGVAKLLTKLEEVCVRHEMPDVPPPCFTARQVSKMPAFSGVYFVWSGNWCDYVGESTNVPKRMKGHNIIRPQDQVSFIPTANHRRDEYFYIWLLNPPKNGRLRQSGPHVYSPDELQEQKP